MDNSTQEWKKFFFMKQCSKTLIIFADMLESLQIKMIQDDFEKFILDLKNKNKPLDFELFTRFSSSLLNFYMGSNLLLQIDKMEATKLLCRLFNAGFKNRISVEDIQQLEEFILQDPSLDYSLLQPVFGL